MTHFATCWLSGAKARLVFCVITLCCSAGLAYGQGKLPVPSPGSVPSVPVLPPVPALPILPLVPSHPGPNSSLVLPPPPSTEGINKSSAATRDPIAEINAGFEARAAQVVGPAGQSEALKLWSGDCPELADSLVKAGLTGSILAKVDSAALYGQKVSGIDVVDLRQSITLRLIKDPGQIVKFATYDPKLVGLQAAKANGWRGKNDKVQVMSDLPEKLVPPLDQATQETCDLVLRHKSLSVKERATIFSATARAFASRAKPGVTDDMQEVVLQRFEKSFPAEVDEARKILNGIRAALPKDAKRLANNLSQQMSRIAQKLRQQFDLQVSRERKDELTVTVIAALAARRDSPIA